MLYLHNTSMCQMYFLYCLESAGLSFCTVTIGIDSNPAGSFNIRPITYIILEQEPLNH